MDLQQLLRTLGKNVVDRRLKLAMSQEDLAKSAGITTTHISRIENGETNVTIGTLHKIARALKTEAKRLVP